MAKNKYMVIVKLEKMPIDKVICYDSGMKNNSLRMLICKIVWTKQLHGELIVLAHQYSHKVLVFQNFDDDWIVVPFSATSTFADFVTNHFHFFMTSLLLPIYLIAYFTNLENSEQ